MKSKRSKACDIPKRVKDAVWERDGHRCIICGSSRAMPNAHYISRSRGGLGIEQNIVTLCTDLADGCHFKFDFGTSEQRTEIGEKIKEYLKSCYPDWSEDGLYYKKGCTD